MYMPGYNFDTMQVYGVSTGGEDPVNESPLRGKWNFQKDSMYSSRPNAFSEGFSKNQIEIINRMIEQKIRNYMENQNYDYYDN